MGQLIDFDPCISFQTFGRQNKFLMETYNQGISYKGSGQFKAEKGTSIGNDTINVSIESKLFLLCFSKSQTK